MIPISDLDAGCAESVAHAFDMGAISFLGAGRSGILFALNNGHVVKIFQDPISVLAESHNLKQISSAPSFPVPVPAYVGHDVAEDGATFFFGCLHARAFLLMSYMPGRPAIEVFGSAAFRDPPAKMQRFIVDFAQSMAAFHDAAWALDLSGPPQGQDIADLLSVPHWTKNDLFRTIGDDFRQALRADDGRDAPLVGVHGDLYMGNVLVGAGHRVSAFIDVAHARRDRAEVEFDSFTDAPRFMDRVIQAYRATTSRPLDVPLIYLRAAATSFYLYATQTEHAEIEGLLTARGLVAETAVQGLYHAQQHMDRLVRLAPQYRPLSERVARLTCGA